MFLDDAFVVYTVDRSDFLVLLLNKQNDFHITSS